MQIVQTNLVCKVLSDGKLQELQIRVSLKTKYNLLTGLSAIGKSVLEDTFDQTYALHNTVDFNSNKWIYLSSYAELSNANIVNNKYDIILVSEYMTRMIKGILFNSKHIDHDSIREMLRDSTCKWIFISRDMEPLPIDFRSVYTMTTKNDVNIITQMFTKEYQFREALRYLTEDENTGYDYYNHHFNNVSHVNGRDKLFDVCQPGDTVIADGAALGNNRILERKDINLYLPESFEFDLAKAWKPDDPAVVNYYQQMPDSTESVEIYFEDDVLPDLCERNHIPRYKKNKHLHPQLLEVKIHKSIKDKLTEYYKSVGLHYDMQVEQDASLVNTSVTTCKNHNVDPNDVDACALLALKLKGVNL